MFYAVSRSIEDNVDDEVKTTRTTTTTTTSTSVSTTTTMTATTSTEVAEDYPADAPAVDEDDEFDEPGDDDASSDICKIVVSGKDYTFVHLRREYFLFKGEVMGINLPFLRLQVYSKIFSADALALPLPGQPISRIPSRV